jgi:hypothetical protein
MTSTLETLLEAAAASREVRDDVTTRELLSAVAKLCMPVAGEGLQSSRRMVAPLVDGLHLSRPLARPREGYFRCASVRDCRLNGSVTVPPTA